jgi:hypothetical protein
MGPFAGFEPCLSFNETVVPRYRIHREDRQPVPGTTNVKLPAFTFSQSQVIAYEMLTTRPGKAARLTGRSFSRGQEDQLA